MVENTASMGRYRALLTDTDREYLRDEQYEKTDERYQARYRVKQRIQEEIPEDVAVLAEHDPDLLEELREVVCTED
jgi:hypothetical protein